MAKTYVVMSHGCIIGVMNSKTRAFDRCRKMDGTKIEIWQNENCVDVISGFPWTVRNEGME